MLNIFKIELDHKRIFGLDVLRALAILFVVIGHGSNLLPERLGNFSKLFIFDGVSIFFVLSGFLIGGILIKLIQENGLKVSALKQFWIRRWFRTLPNYFLILLILCLLHLFFSEDFTFRSVNKFFIFSQNLLQEHPAWFFPEAWSLSVEEWFYLILPILIGLIALASNKQYKIAIFSSCIIIIGLVVLFRLYRYNSTIINDINERDLIFRKQVFTRLDSLMFGVIGAYVNHYFHHIWIKHKVKLFCTGILFFMCSKFIIPQFVAFNGIYFCVFSFSLISIATLFLLPYLSELKSNKGILYKPIMYISLTSYSMYLLNLSVIQTWIIHKIPWQRFFDKGYLIVISKYGTFWILVVTLSILVYKYFEVPMTSLRDKRTKKITVDKEYSKRMIS